MTPWTRNLRDQQRAFYQRRAFRARLLWTVAIFALVGIGLNVLIGLTGQVSFGHVGFYAIGAYGVAILTTRAGLSFWLAWPLAALLAGLCVWQGRNQEALVYANAANNLAQELGAQRDRINALEVLGAAYLAGFHWGLDEGFGVLISHDADGSHQPEELPRLLRAISAGADMVKGSRWVKGFTEFYPAYLASLADVGWPIDAYSVHLYPLATGTPRDGDDPLPGSGDVSDDDKVTLDEVTPAISVAKTVYRGHDDGLGCTGQDRIFARSGDDVTWCIEVTNTGETVLDIHVTDPDVGLDDNVNDLAPGDSALLRRDMVGYRMVTRNVNGSEYRRVEQKPPPELRLLLEKLGARTADV